MPVKNYCYRAMRATELANKVDEQIRLAHEYRNRLCKLELDRRDEHDSIIRDLCDDYVQCCAAVTQAEESIEEIYRQAKARSAQARAKVPMPKAERDQVAALRKSLKDLRAKRRAAKTEAYARRDVCTALDGLKERYAAFRRDARAESGLYWGTYLVVEDSCRSFGSGPPPRFHRWNGTGKVAVQLQLGRACDELSDSDSRIRIEVESHVENISRRLAGFLRWARSQRELEHLRAGRERFRTDHHRPHAVLWMRVGSMGREPLMARVPFVFHRPFPEGGKLKWAYLETTKTASDKYWQLRFSVQVPLEVRRVSGGYCAVHVGWRLMPNGDLRVATWFGFDGRAGMLRIPARRVGCLDKCDDIRSIRQKRFNRMCHRVAQWIDAAQSRGLVLPAWLRDERPKMKSWKRIDRLVRLILHWRKDRFAGDERIVRLLDGEQSVPRRGWRKRDKHLWLWACHARKNLARWRNDEYRVLARRLADRYGRVSILQSDWAEMRQKPGPGDEERQTTRMRFHSSLSAVATLERFLRESFGPDCVVGIDTRNLTRDCRHCGHRNTIGEQRMHTCRGCGRRWDVDKNGLENQYARTLAAMESAPSLASIMASRVRANSEPPKKSKIQLAREAARKSKK